MLVLVIEIQIERIEHEHDWKSGVGSDLDPLLLFLTGCAYGQGFLTGHVSAIPINRVCELQAMETHS